MLYPIKKGDQIMKKLVIFGTLFLTGYAVQAQQAPQITNISNVSIVVVPYGTNYVPAQNNKSPRGRLPQQPLIIPIGNNAAVPQGASSVDICCGNGTHPPVHLTVQSGASYTVTQGTPCTVTQD